MSDLEQTAIERLRFAAKMSLRRLPRREQVGVERIGGRAMTEKEIIQTLRICATHIEKGCGLCPQMKYVRCTERLADEAITMIERLTAENAALREKVPQWVSVDDRHPKPGTRVLATDGVFVGEAYRTSADTWRRYDGIAMRDCIGSVVTHWMPLPEAPEEGEKA